MSDFKVGDTAKTRDGRKARIVAIGINTFKSIVAAITERNGEESIQSYAPDGQFYRQDLTGLEHPLDLI